MQIRNLSSSGTPDWFAAQTGDLPAARLDRETGRGNSGRHVRAAVILSAGIHARPFLGHAGRLRLLLLLSGATGLALWFPLKWHRWVWQTRQLEQAARLLRHRFPRVGDQLLGIVELAHNEMEQERSESLCRAAMRQVDEEVRDCDFRGAVPDPRHRRWAWATGGVLLLAAAVLGIVPAAGTNALARWLFPWKNTERYTFAQLNQLPDQMVVPLAEPFVVDARLSPRSAWSPEQGRARYGRQEPVLADRDVDQYQFCVATSKGAGRSDHFGRRYEEEDLDCSHVASRADRDRGTYRIA